VKSHLTGIDASCFEKVIELYFVLLHAFITSVVYREAEGVMEITPFKHVAKCVDLREGKQYE
jgi:hypothetical protein